MPISQTTKRTYLRRIGTTPPAVLPYELMSLDTISGFAKYGNSQTFLHVVVDHATRYAWAFPSRSTSILTYTQVIKKVMHFGSPKRLLTDRAPAFNSPIFRRFLIRHNIGQLLTTSNNPQANGLSERLNATITGKLKLLRFQQPKTAWTKLLPQVLQAYNNTPHSVTGFPPSYLMLEPDMEDKSSWEIWSDKNDEAFGIIITKLTNEQAGMFIGETNSKKREATIEEIQQILREKESRRNMILNQLVENGHEQAYRIKDRKVKQFQPKRCFVCNKKGHLANDCWFRDKQKQGYQKKWTPDYRNHKYSRKHSNNLVDTMKSGINEQAFETYAKEFEDSPNGRNDKQIWCIDSGCTSHLTPNLTLMENVTEYKSEINLAEKRKTIQATAKGDMRLTTCASEGQENIRIKDILHVPNLRNNFLSDYDLVNKGNSVIFNKNGAKIYNEGNDLVDEAYIKDRMFMMETKLRNVPIAKNGNVMVINTHLSNKNSNISLWHKRLNHINEEYMKKMIQGHIVRGLDLKFERSIKLHTPMQRWNGRKPSVKHIRIFGCLTHWLEGKRRRNKFSPKGRKGIFIGYSIKRKAYRIYDIMTKRIHEVRSVNICEDKGGIDYANDIQEDTNCDNLTYKGNCEEIVEDFLILKEDNPVTESEMKSKEDTSVKLGGDCENDSSQTEPIEERCAVQLEKKPQEVQVAIFMASIGQLAQKIYKTFKLNEGEENKLQELKGKFNEYFTPKLNYTVERYQFNNIKQCNEPFKEFLTKVKLQAKKCKFDQMEDELIKDRIVVGIQNNDVREKLLSDPDLNITKAIQICVAAENTNTQLREIKDRNENEPSISTIERKISRDFSQKAFNPRDTTSFKKLINNCTRCGAKHEINKCPAYGKVCDKCKKANHFSKLCKTAKRERVVNLVEDTEVESDEFSLSINEIKTRNGQEWLERVTFKGNQTVNFKLDTGAQCNVIPLTLSKKLKLKINSSIVRKLLTYSGESIRVMGETNVTCTIKSKAVVLRFIISEKGITPILGRDACSQLGLIYRVDEVCPEMEFEELFKGIGLIRNYKYKADFSEIPKNLPIKPARKIPFAIKDNVKKELDEMEALGIIKKVNHPTPISSHMVMVRKDGKIRICLDPSDLNKILLRREFPLKRLEDIAVTLHKSKYFTKLDLKKSVWQLPVDEETQPYLTFSTPWGRYSFLRVPFGIKTAPEIMQQIMTDLLSDLKGVENSMDDILIHAPDLDTLRKRTYEVLSLLKSTGIKLNKEKCVFEREQVKFLGHLISKAGIQIDPGKVKAINDIQSPRNRKELQRLLEGTCFEILYPNAALTMSVDASSHAVGAVLMQDNRPIAFASATLIDYQRNYPQIEKEALAIQFGCRKFHKYIFGRPVLVETDHKPLETIFKKCLSKSPLRLQRILLELQPYDLKVKYVRGKDMFIADLLNRDCVEEEKFENEHLEILLCISMPQGLTNNELVTATETDPELSQLKSLLINGWPEHKSGVPIECRLYWPFREEISLHEGLIFKGLRIIIPKSLRVKVLKSLHIGHIGINGTLQRAKESIYWPGVTKDIINQGEKCMICISNSRSNQKQTIINKEIPKFPWQIVASDVFMYNDHNYLLVTDSYSGYIDFKELKSLNSKETIVYLKEWFAQHGIPKVLETDNGTNYSSREFKQFSQEWSFTHQTSSPLHPRSNGLAERAVQTAKSLLRKCERGKEDIQMALLNYRNTPREGLGSPVQRLYSRRTRTVLPIKEDLLEPSQLSENQPVFLKERERVWTPATVVKQLSPRSYAVRSQDRILRRNQAFLRPFHGEPEAQTSSMDYHKEMEINGPPPLESEHASPRPVPTLLDKDKTDKGSHPSTEPMEPSQTLPATDRNPLRT
ncbi:K02A2.6-like, partial [Cordylochernes scorpioides]